MPDPLTTLTELAELQSKCTPGDWHHDGYQRVRPVDGKQDGANDVCHFYHSHPECEANMKFLAEARNTPFATIAEQWQAAERQAAWLRERLTAIRAKIETIVCTKHPDDGVVLLSEESPCHHVEGVGQVYDHEHFSPLGDALIELHEMTTLEAALTAAMGSVTSSPGSGGSESTSSA